MPIRKDHLAERLPVKAAAILLLLLFLMPAASPAQDEKSEVGRYQIFSGTTEVLNQNSKGGISSDRIPIVIKIDTKTGNTWILVTIFAKDSSGQGWQGLGEYQPLLKPKP